MRPVLPDRDSWILRSYVFGPSGFWTMAPLRSATKFDPFLSLDCAREEGLGAQGGGCGFPSGNPGWVGEGYKAIGALSPLGP